MFSLPSNIILGNGTILIISYTKSKEPNKQIAPNGYINTGVGFEIYRWDIKNKRSIESTVCGKMDTNNFHIAIIHHVNEEQSVKSFLREKLNADKWTTDERELTQHHDRKKWRDHLLKSNTGISVESDFSYSKWHAKRDIEISNPRFSHGEKQDCLGMLVGMIVVIVLIFLGNLIVREIIEESIHATEPAIASATEPATPTPTQKLNENKECIDDVETKFLEARGYHKEEQLKKANKLYREIIDNCKTHVNAYIGLYNVYYDSSQHAKPILIDNLISIFKEGIEDNSESANLHHYLGLIHHEQKHYDLAIVNQSKAITLINQSKAITLINQSKAIPPDLKYYQAYIARGDAYFYSNEYTKAITDYKSSLDEHYGISEDEEKAEIYFKIGESYYEMKDDEKARTNYHDAIEYHEEHTGAHYKIGETYLREIISCNERNNKYSDSTTSGDLTKGCRSLYEAAANAYNSVIDSNNPKYMDSIAYKKRGCMNFFLENYAAQKEDFESYSKKTGNDMKDPNIECEPMIFKNDKSEHDRN